MSDILIAIPARLGSKRLAQKNILPLQGKPMLAYTIEAALNSGLSDEVYVCTEAPQIAKVAAQYGAKVFMIPASEALDDVSSTRPCLQLLQELDPEQKRFQQLFNLQPTSPLRNAADLVAAYQQFQAANADFLLSVTPIDPHYCHWALTDEGGAWRMLHGKEFLKERLELPVFYRPNGAIKLANCGPLTATENYFGDKLIGYLMPEERSIHVATQFDLTCAAAVLQTLEESPCNQNVCA